MKTTLQFILIFAISLSLSSFIAFSGFLGYHPEATDGEFFDKVVILIQNHKNGFYNRPYYQIISINRRTGAMDTVKLVTPNNFATDLECPAGDTCDYLVYKVNIHGARLSNEPVNDPGHKRVVGSNASVTSPLLFQFDSGSEQFEFACASLGNINEYQFQLAGPFSTKMDFETIHYLYFNENNGFSSQLVESEISDDNTWSLNRNILEGGLYMWSVKPVRENSPSIFFKPVAFYLPESGSSNILAYSDGSGSERLSIDFELNPNSYMLNYSFRNTSLSPKDDLGFVVLHSSVSLDNPLDGERDLDSKFMAKKYFNTLYQGSMKQGQVNIPVPNRNGYIQVVPFINGLPDFNLAQEFRI